MPARCPTATRASTRRFSSRYWARSPIRTPPYASLPACSAPAGDWSWESHWHPATHTRSRSASCAGALRARALRSSATTAARLPTSQASARVASRRSAGPAGRVLPRPGRDVLRVLDDLTVVEDQYWNPALAGQPLDLLATARDVGQRCEAVGLHHLWRVAGFLQRVVGVLARVRPRPPRAATPRPRNGERPPADVELHDASCTTTGSSQS